MEKFISFTDGKVQSLCDWRGLRFAWRGSPSAEEFSRFVTGGVHFVGAWYGWWVILYNVVL